MPAQWEPLNTDGGAFLTLVGDLHAFSVEPGQIEMNTSKVHLVAKREAYVRVADLPIVAIEFPDDVLLEERLGSVRRHHIERFTVVAIGKCSIWLIDELGVSTQVEIGPAKAERERGKRAFHSGYLCDNKKWTACASMARVKSGGQRTTCSLH